MKKRYKKFLEMARIAMLTVFVGLMCCITFNTAAKKDLDTVVSILVVSITITRLCNILRIYVI